MQMNWHLNIANTTTLHTKKMQSILNSMLSQEICQIY